MRHTKPAAIMLIAAVIASITSGVVVAGHVVEAAAPVEAERHCVIETTGIKGGVFITKPEVCFKSRISAAMHARSISPNIGEGIHRRALLSGHSATNTIGVHYTSTWYRGSSVSIVGTTCGGGVWRPTGTWQNNIESSQHYCGGSPTTFYDSATCRGLSRPIEKKTHSLEWMNNRASCVRYG